MKLYESLCFHLRKKCFPNICEEKIGSINHCQPQQLQSKKQIKANEPSVQNSVIIFGQFIII